MNKLQENLSWGIGVLVALLLCAPFLIVVAPICAVRQIRERQRLTAGSTGDRMKSRQTKEARCRPL